jgi:Pentapeptide repeats (8 copies)
MHAILKRPNRMLQVAAAMLPLVAFAAGARADIFQWEHYINPVVPSRDKLPSTTLCLDGAGIDAVPGADLSSRNLTLAYLILANLTGADLSRANLIEADLSWAALTDANLAGAHIQGANFGASPDFGVAGITYMVYGTGITLDQLYSTASYKEHDLSGVGLGGSELAGANFVGQNLTNSQFANHFGVQPEHGWYPTYATLTDADFTGADVRGASDLNLSATTTINLIQPNGHISDLNLPVGELLVVHDYDGDFRFEPARPAIPITIDQRMAMGPGGTLRMVFETDAWDSTISFAPGIPVALGGTLELTFAAGVNLASQVGRTFDLFNWTGVSPTGAFAVSSPYSWNLSNLYTTGEVTLTAVPEPASFALAAAGAISLSFYRRRKIL